MGWAECVEGAVPRRALGRITTLGYTPSHISPHAIRLQSPQGCHASRQIVQHVVGEVEVGEASEGADFTAE